MNIRHRIAANVSGIKARLRRLTSALSLNSGKGWSAEVKWRNLLTMDLNEAFHKIREKIKPDSTDAQIQIRNPQCWPVWFRVSILCGVFLCVLSVVAIPIWSDVLGELRHKKQESHDQMLRYKRFAAEVSLQAQYRNHVEALEVSFGEMLEMIPAELEMVQVLNQFSQVARSSGVRLDLFKPESEVREESYAVLPVKMRLSGSFSDITRFLEAVSGMKHLVTVDIAIESNELEPGNNVLMAQVKAYRGDSTGQKTPRQKALDPVDATR